MRYIKSTIARPGPYILAIILLSLTACGNDGSSDAPGTTTVSGIASKGPIHGGTVTVFSLQADGGKGAQLGTPATTAADGAFSVTLGEYSGNVILEISGGSYIDEATGATVANTTTLRCAVTNVRGHTEASITALTEAAVQLAELRGQLTTNNINGSNTRLSQLTGFNIITTTPADALADGADTQTENAQAYGVALAGISQMLADGTAINNSGVTVPDGIAGVIASLALDLADNNQLDSNIFAYVSAMATFVQGENNRTNPEVSANLLQLLTDNGNGDTSVGSTEPNIAHWFAGNWFIIEHDDGVRPDGMADDPADEHNSSVTITVNDDGSWNWSTPTSDSLISASKITIDQSRLTATIPDDSGQGRTVLTYNYDNKTIDGQWQKLADDNVTYYKNYETWLMVPPLPCNTVGGPHSHGGFLSAVADCGTQQPFVAEDLVGKTIYFADEPGAQITFDDLGSAFIVRDGGTREYLNWYPDHNGLLELYTNDSSSTIEFRKHIAWLGIDSATGGLKTKVYSEGDTTWPSDFVFDGTADGAISDTAMVVVADIGPNAVQYVGSWASPCLNTAGNPAGAFVMLEITLNYQGEFNDSAIFYSDASCSTMTTSTTSSGTFSMGADIALTNGSTGTALDKHITLENGNAVDKMSYTIAQLPAPGVMLMANEHTSASERDLDTDPFLWWLYYPQ